MLPPTILHQQPLRSYYAQRREVQMPEPQPYADEAFLSSSPDARKEAGFQPPRMPDYWHPPDCEGYPTIVGAVVRWIFTAFCLIAFGHSSLQHVWDCCHPHVEEDIWKESRGLLQRRHENITVTAGLLLATIAAFVTTVPPEPDLLEYTNTGPYICLLLSFGTDLGGLIVGSAMLFTMTKCHAEWFRQTLMGSRMSIYCAFLLMSYPFLSIGLSSVVCAIGLIVAASHSKNPVIKTGSLFVILVPSSLALVFSWVQLTGLSRGRRQREDSASGSHQRS
ncbi:hypothetical protein PLICRDRAFT_52435 [Plicaturopsis crispa FD-325 SS-3]|nr:hypothetical protein PLICRDRAFT_52435 [Plicaturopsis crispa FD-325 SS-3]